MDLKKRLNLGQSKKLALEIVDYVNGSPIRFKELVKIYLNGPYRITQRAALPLSYCIEKWPYLIDSHWKKIIHFIEKPEAQDAVKRNTMRLLQFVDIPKRYHGAVAGLCFRYLQDPKVAVAIRVFSMTVLDNIINDQPDIQKELKLILEDQMPYGSAAFKNRAMKILKRLSAVG
jgi:hypothetical protein